MYTLIYGSLIILIPGIIFSLYAQYKVNSTFTRYSKIESSSRFSAENLSSLLLEQSGCHGVVIGRTHGHLTDHYNPQTNALNLSDTTYGRTNVAALGVASHECGHAVQKHENSLLLTLRTFLVPLTRYGSILAVPIAILGVILELLIGGVGTNFGTYVLALGILLYATSTIFALVTLPVEIDASRRAVAMLDNTSFFDERELKAVKRVLYAAALTYVATLVVSFLYLLRFIILLNQFRKRD